MFLSDISIRRPVLAIVASLLLIVFGLYSYNQMPAREYPSIDPPVVSINTVYRGASAQIIESQITQVIEDSVSGISGVRTIKSQSRDGSSSVTIEFNPSRNIDDAANDVRDRISRAMFSLPQDVEQPLINKRESDADPFFWISLSSSERNLMELSDYARRYLLDQFTAIDGVANVFVGGERRFAMRVWLNRAEMAARRITVGDIEQALRRQNVEIPAGRLESEKRELTVRTDTRLNTPEQFARIVVGRNGDDFVRLGDVARVEVGASTERLGLRFNGRDNVGLGLVKQSQANALEVARVVKDVLKEIEPTIPPDIELNISRDDSFFVEVSLREVYIALTFALSLVIVVIYIFIGNFRATIIPAITIPIAIIASFTVLNALGFSINVLTLLALALAIGLVVDDAIIVMENISRRIENHEEPLIAAFLGSRQIYFAVLATTTVLIAVFVPIALLQGNIGRLFSEFAVAVGAAVLFSTLVALTLTPMLCSRLLSERTTEGLMAKITRTLVGGLRVSYRAILSVLLKVPLLVIAVWALLIPVTWFLYTDLPKTLTPIQDRGEFSVILETPEGGSWDYLIEHVDQAEAVIDRNRDTGEVRATLSMLSTNFSGGEGAVTNAVIVVKLNDWKSGRRPAPEIVSSMGRDLRSIPGARIIPFNRRGLGQRGNEAPLDIVISGYDYEELARWRDLLFAELRGSPQVVNLRADYRETRPELRIEIDRDRATALGIDVEDIGRTLETMFGGRVVTRFIQNGEEYDVKVQADDVDRRTPSDLTNTFIRSPSSGELISVGSLVDIQDAAGPAQLNRFNRLRSIKISAQLGEGYQLGDAIEEVERAFAEVLPPEAQLRYDGQAREFKESTFAIYFAFGLALLVVFLVLAAQFESFVHPFVIIATVPLGAFGALLANLALGLPVTIYTQIGLVMLIGLVAKNAILVVEFANQLRREGVAFDDAILESATTRLRPILMTSIATTMGALPLAIATGAGSEARQAIGVVIVGGVIVGSLLSLFISPVLYKAFARNTPVGDEASKKLDSLLAKRQGSPAE